MYIIYTSKGYLSAYDEEAEFADDPVAAHRFEASDIDFMVDLLHEELGEVVEVIEVEEGI